MEKPDGPKDPELLKCWNVQQDHRASRGALRKMVSRYNIILIRKKNRIHISNTRANNCRLILLYGSNYFQTVSSCYERTYQIERNTATDSVK